MQIYKISNALTIFYPSSEKMITFTGHQYPPVSVNLPLSRGKVVTYILMNLLRTIIDFAALRAFAAIRFQSFLK